MGEKAVPGPWSLREYQRSRARERNMTLSKETRRPSAGRKARECPGLQGRGGQEEVVGQTCQPPREGG